MKTTHPSKKVVMPVLVMALVAGAVGTATASQIATRPLSEREIGAQFGYGLPEDTRPSGGLHNNAGLGQPVYLEAQLDQEITNVTGAVTWAVTATPPGSAITAVEASPITDDVPLFSPRERDLYQLVLPRAMLVPTNTGPYTITATIPTTTTNIVLTLTIQCSTYMGWHTCAFCHNGGSPFNPPNKYTPWLQTGHAVAFSDYIDGFRTDHFRESCLQCHTLGYDTNSLADNDGFDDRAAAEGWMFPTNLVPGNWASMMTNYPDTAETAAVQCESCHGAGSEHAYSAGDPSKITVTLSAGDCGQCHDAPAHHNKNIEWYNSTHAIITDRPEGNQGCARCHSGIGFVDYVDGRPQSELRADYEAITCGTCHDPHSQMTNSAGMFVTNPHIIRTLKDVTLNDVSAPGGATVITNGGMGKICMNCHQGRQDALTYANDLDNVSSHFGPHHGPQTDMLAGANAWTYGKTIPGSTHLVAVADACVTCHMQENTLSNTNSDYQVGGHTFKPAWDAGTPGDESDDEDLVAACQGCHGGITTFNFPKQDYNGDGVIEGVQTEVHHLLDELGMLLPPVGNPSVSLGSIQTVQQLEAAFNYQFVLEDGSFGIHNASYAVGLLKASIADLTDDANRDGLPDSWQIQYFGDINSTNAAPSATPAGDGIPNWLKFNLNLNPLVAGITLPDGVMWANATSEDNNGESTRIYTAAEIVFDTVVGTTYQVQAISAMGEPWEDVGAPIAGTGKKVSFMTPTRHNDQQFFQVVTVP